jgi:hypothetical protein
MVFDGRVYWDNITRVASSADPLCFYLATRGQLKRKLSFKK